MTHFPVSFAEGYFDQEYYDVQTELEKMASEKIVRAFQDKIARENSKVHSSPIAKRHTSSKAAQKRSAQSDDPQNRPTVARAFVAMDHLRSDVNLRSCRPARSLTGIQA